MTASGITPPAASLPYWEQVFFDDFDTDVPRGGWPGPYSSRWDAYNWGPDTSKQGWYTTETTSVSDSSLILGIGDQGLPRLASVAPIPLISGHTTPSKISGQTYGRYDICYRVDTSLTEPRATKQRGFCGRTATCGRRARLMAWKADSREPSVASSTRSVIPLSMQRPGRRMSASTLVGMSQVFVGNPVLLPCGSTKLVSCITPVRLVIQPFRCIG
jgi:hypothetical protein